MNKFIMLSAAAALLTACADAAAVDGEEDDGNNPDVVVSNGTVSLGDLSAADFDAGDNELTVVITLDGNNVQQLYDFEGSDDSGTYSEFSQQLDSTDRIFTGFGAQSSDGSVQAVVVSDGGQFNRFFGGAFATQNDFEAPASGIVNFSGAYIGLVNFPDGPSDGGVDGSDSSVPRASGQVTGDVFFKADFADNAVNGAIFNRELGGEDLPEIVLTIGSIAADGSFTGTAELIDLTGVGQYSGVFGGDGATSVAGVIRLEDGFLDEPGEEPDEEDDDSGNEVEHGIFVLDADDL